jgi:uncharacterized protein
MKTLLAAVMFFCLVLPATSRAQESASGTPATKEDVEAYLKVMNSHEMMINMVNAMSKPMHQMIHQQFLKDRDKLPPDFEQHMNNMMDDMFKNMPFDDMIQAMVPTYQKHFSKEDLAEMSAFYSTPTGQKILKEMPAIMSESMQNVMPVMSKYMETVRDRVQQEMNRSLQQDPAGATKNSPN